MEALRNLFAIADLRNRVLFTLGMLAVYRAGSFIPTPGINRAALAELSRQMQNSMFGLYDMFTGGQLSQVTIFALGVMPYISASIILQLLTVVWPYLERLSKEGELGRRKITQYTRYLTLVLAVVQSMGIAIWLERNTEIANGLPLVYEPGWGFRLLCVLTLTTGSMFIMWLGEQITERGIGNGMSLIIFAGIVVGFPRAVLQTFDLMETGQLTLLRLLILAVLMVGVVAAIIYVERGHRRISVQYAKRVVGRRQYGGTSTHIPLKVNTGGVIPVIFASSILAFPATFAPMFAAGGWGDAVVRQLNFNMPLYNLFYVALILFFAYFYTAIIFNPDDVAENMRKYGGFIPGIRPGKKTAEHIDAILSRITLVGAVYLAMVALLPQFLIGGFNVAPIPVVGESLDANLPRWFTQGLGVPFVFGGTSLLIVVGVAMDTVNQVESQLIMRHYDGFMKKTRIRGRRG
ncbi:MAG TPA: preprotein translocase subunit SecY [Vicinamibacterales bacterium]|nr:preprotein translocase subunit SecY [Vicinamibacterales bacterium]